MTSICNRRRSACAAKMLWDDPQRNSNPAFDPARDLGPGAPGRDLPTTFGETFSAAWSRNTLFSQDYFGENDRMAALSDYTDKIKAMTGRDIAAELDYGTYGGGMMPDSHALLRQANGKVNELKKQNPELEIAPLSPEEFEQNAVAKRKKADADFEETI